MENFTRVPEVIQKGAKRIELCDNLSVGGTTVSYGIACKTIQYCKSKSVEVMAMIRPRGGNFIYNKDEIEIMKEDISALKRLGTDGVVFGCLTESNWIDENAMLYLLQEANGLDVAFHMAFDEIAGSRQFEAIEWLENHGVKRILTHGGPGSIPIEKNLNRLKEYIDFAADRIIIMPGGGITNENLSAIAEKITISEAHGTRIVG